MTISSKLRISSILVLIISIAFGYSLWQTSQNLQSQRNVNNLIQDIIKKTFEFSIITNEYLTNRTPRVQSQWGNTHVSLETLFSQASNVLYFNDDKTSLKKIISNEMQAEQFLIGLIVKNKAEHKHKHKHSPSQSRGITQTISQIHVRVQGMLSEASRMSRRSLERLTAAEQRLEHSSMLLIFIYFSFFVIAFLLVQKKVIKPIVNLQRLAKQLALGDYESRIPVVGHDEISALAKAYNTLAKEIQKKINTLTDKSKRLTESKKDLLSLNVNLQTMVEEQTSDIRNNENKQRAILESMTDGVITLDHNFNIKSINPAVTKIFQYSLDELNQQNINFLVSDLKDIENDSGAFIEKQGHLKSGASISIEIALNKMLINDSFMYACIIRDISERKRNEQLKGEFVSNVSHELRTPLTSIRGALSLVNNGVLDDLPEKKHTLLTTAYNNTERLMHLINDLLDMQKIEAGKLDFNIRDVNLSEAMKKSIVDNESYAKQHNVKIEIDKSVEDAIIKTDSLRLDQIMSNLLSNAAKFSPAESTILINSAIENSFAKISVVDSGEGIPEEYFDSIFHKFTQNDASASRKKGGTGLGLALTKQMVEAMGGSINFTSTIGKGTVFNVYLPLS